MRYAFGAKLFPESESVVERSKNGERVEGGFVEQKKNRVFYYPYAAGVNVRRQQVVAAAAAATATKVYFAGGRERWRRIS